MLPDPHVIVTDGTAPTPTTGLTQGNIVNADLWTEVTDSGFVAASIIWYLQKFFASFPDAVHNFPYSSDPMEKNRIQIQLAYTTPPNESIHMPAIIVYSPARTFTPIGASDYGWEKEVEGDDGYYSRNYSGRFEYTIQIDTRSDAMSATNDIASLIMTAFTTKYWKNGLTHYTGLWVDPSVTISHSALDTIGIVGDTNTGRKIFQSTISFGLLSYGGLTNKQTLLEIQDIITHYKYSEGNLGE